MMSLDKQKILNELGSVMNQLQSANCGCMGRLFRNQNSNWNGNGNAMGAQSNNQNCVQPAAYPNSCMNLGGGGNMGAWSNNMGGGNMGGGNMVRGNMGGGNMGGGNMGGGNMGGMNMGGMNMGAGNMSCPHMRGHNSCSNMGGNMPMGQNPVKLYSDTYRYLNQNLVQPAIQEVYDDLRTMTPENTVMNNSAKPQMDNAANPPNMNGGMAGNTAGGMGMGGMGMGGMGHNIVNMMSSAGQAGKKVAEQSPPDGTQNLMNAMPIMDPNNRGLMPIHQQMGNRQLMANPQQLANPQQQITNPSSNVTQNNIQAYSAQAPSQAPAQKTQQHSGGQNHAQSLAKFNQMLPGVSNKFRDLGFDPMSIALQMNPQNPNGGPTAAEASMKRILENNAARAQHGGIQPLALQPGAIQPGSMQPGAMQQGAMQQGTIQPGTVQPTAVYRGGVQSNGLGELEQGEAQEGEVIPDHNTQPVTQSLVQDLYHADVDPLNRELVPSSVNNKLEPIYPSNLANNQLRQSNTLHNSVGRPVQLNPSLTSPQVRYSNVKSRASRTSLLDQHLRRASKSQLQDLYHRYTEPHARSNTQQNVQPSIRIPTHSDNRLDYMNNKNIVNGSPIEKVGGDTLANNRMESNKLDAGADKYAANNTGHGRNGLQDVVYTSAKLLPAWSFHGY